MHLDSLEHVPAKGDLSFLCSSRLNYAAKSERIRHWLNRYSKDLGYHIEDPEIGIPKGHELKKPLHT